MKQFMSKLSHALNADIMHSWCNHITTAIWLALPPCWQRLQHPVRIHQTLLPFLLPFFPPPRCHSFPVARRVWPRETSFLHTSLTFLPPWLCIGTFSYEYFLYKTDSSNYPRLVGRHFHSTSTVKFINFRMCCQLWSYNLHSLLLASAS